MAVRQTATTQTTPRPPRKPAKASQSDKGKTRARKSATGRQTAKGTGPTRPNPFDDIARQVNADQEAKDREAGRDDLTPALAKSVDQAKTKRAATKPAKPARPAKPATPTKPVKPTVPTKVQANGKPTTTFKGRPTSNPTTIAARAKEAGLRVRKDADPADIAIRLRATVEATKAWLESRNGSAPTPPTAKAKAASKAPAEVKPKPDKVPSILVGHAFEGAAPKDIPELKGATLVVRYTVQPSGEVHSQLWGIRDADGQHISDWWQLPLDARPKLEKVNGRKVTLKDRTKKGLAAWLAKEGLTDK
jgi:hypothetical protein